jgi:indole-3-glycerol phosphate synthase
MNYLDRILRQKKEEVHRRIQQYPLERLRERPGYAQLRRSLRGALQAQAPAVVAEIKRASPSKGVIRENFDPGAIARSYVAGGAAALSVLTDEPFFGGRLEYLENARQGHALPVLRKDFIIDSYQLHEARAFGADAVLLIVAALGGKRVAALQEEARELGLESLVEIHNEAELAELAGTSVALLGINNRDLTTFATTLDVTLRIAPHVPAGSLIVSESGIAAPEDVQRLMAQGINAMLVGEAFMRSDDPGGALRQLVAEACGRA